MIAVFCTNLVFILNEVYGVPTGIHMHKNTLADILRYRVSVVYTDIIITKHFTINNRTCVITYQSCHSYYIVVPIL